MGIICLVEYFYSEQIVLVFYVEIAYEHIAHVIFKK
jgi:hypothetical protein